MTYSAIAPALKVIRTAPVKFSAKDFAVEQKFAPSPDGTKVPYFVVRSKAFKADGTSAAIMSGYGGFDVSELPFFSNSSPTLFLEKGTIKVIANIRGGGEYGPNWHKQGMLKNKQKSYDDFIAVAEDLLRTGYVAKGRLGIEGASNGGLLVAAVAMQRPDLFRAVACGVPPLDMMRYTELSAGPSWNEEYGDPRDASMREVIAKYSPYQNVKADAVYPRIFFTSSSTDDRVHPGHARKMTAKMLGMKHDAYFFEETLGGHGGGGNINTAVRDHAYVRCLHVRAVRLKIGCLSA